MENDKVLSFDFDYGFVNLVRRAISVAVESMKDGGYIKQLCVLDERLGTEAQRLERLEQTEKKRELEAKLREVEFELKHIN